MKKPYTNKIKSFTYQRVTYPILLLFISIQLFIVVKNDCTGQQSITWQRVYGLDSNIYGQSGIQTFDGGYMIQSSCVMGRPCGTYLIKTDAWGNVQWQRSYIIRTSEDIIQTNDSGYILVGSVMYNAGIFKISKTGDSLWIKEYGGPDSERFFAIKRYFDGGYLLCGEGNWTNYLSSSYIVRIDLYGNLIWEKFIYDSSNSLIPINILYDLNNNISIVGYASTISPFNKDLFMLKLNSYGNLYIKKIFYTYPIREGGMAIIKSFDNNYIISGWADYADSLHSTVVKMDTSLNLIFRKYYTDGTPFVTKTIDNNYMLGGSIFVEPLVWRIALKKIDQSGDEIWTKVINGSYLYTEANDMIITSDGGYFLVGDFFRDGPQDRYSTYTVKTDTEGNAIPIGILNNYTNVYKDFELYPAYPNPFNLSTIIRYDINKDDIYSLEIYDLLGKLVNHMFTKFHKAGKYEITLSNIANNLTSSVYFVKLSSTKYSRFQKLVFLK